MMMPGARLPSQDTKGVSSHLTDLQKTIRKEWKAPLRRAEWRHPGELRSGRLYRAAPGDAKRLGGATSLWPSLAVAGSLCLVATLAVTPMALRRLRRSQRMMQRDSSERLAEHTLLESSSPAGDSVEEEGKRALSSPRE
jgi:hypothetical protein